MAKKKTENDKVVRIQQAFEGALNERIEEVALPLAHALKARKEADRKIKELRPQVLDALTEESVESYRVEDAGVKATFERKQKTKLSFSLEIIDDESSEEDEAA